MEFNGTFTKAGNNIEGARVVEPHPDALVSPSSFVNIANNYSWSGLITYQVSTFLCSRFRCPRAFLPYPLSSGSRRYFRASLATPGLS